MAFPFLVSNPARPLAKPVRHRNRPIAGNRSYIVPGFVTKSPLSLSSEETAGPCGGAGIRLMPAAAVVTPRTKPEPAPSRSDAALALRVAARATAEAGDPEHGEDEPDDAHRNADPGDDEEEDDPDDDERDGDPDHEERVPSLE